MEAHKPDNSNYSVDDIQKEIAHAPTLKAILDMVPMAMNVWDENMNGVMCNKHVATLFGLESEKDYLERVHTLSPQYQPNGVLSTELGIQNFQKALAEGAYVFNWMHQTSNGESIPSEVALYRLAFQQRQFIVGFVRDLRQEFSQLGSEEYNYYFTDAVPTGVLLNEISALSEEWFFSIDLRTGNMQQYMRSIDMSSADGASALAVENIIKSGFVHQDDIDVYKKIVENLSNGVFEPYDIRILNELGEYRYSRLVYKVIKDKADKPIFIIGKGVDVHEQRLLEERSQKDLLTNCYNKISAEQIIAEKLKRRPEATHALFIIDIDNFKGVNDNLGHFFGDEVLKEIADGLHAVFRGGDIIARIGGDEFIVFIENIDDRKVIEDKAKNILKIYNKTFSGEFKDYAISGSVGIALFPQNGKVYDDLYQNADKALYQAKASGKNRFVIYTDELNVGTMRNTTKIENADRIAGVFFDYDLISAVFNILYERGGDKTSIDFALKYICQKYNADRSYIFETLDSGLTYDNTFEFCKAGISSEIDNLQQLPAEIFADFIENAHNGIIYSNNLRETLEIDIAFETMVNQGILSFVHAQIKKDGMMTFFIGLDDCTKTRVWSEKEINSLQYMGKLLSIILQGTHLREEVDKLAENNKNSAHILNSTDDVVYIADTENYDLLYLNETGFKAVGSPGKEILGSVKCYKMLQGLDAPCEFCTNHLLKSDEFYEWTFYNPVIEATFLLKDKLIPFNGKLARLEIATNISKTVTLEKELQERLVDEKFLSGCVELLHSGNDPSVSIYKLLKRVAGYYKSERSYIFEVSECGEYLSNTYEWCEDVVPGYQSELQQLPISELSFLFERCKKQQSFSMRIDDESMSKQSLEYHLMKIQKLTNLTICSIVSDDRITGFVGMDNPQRNAKKALILETVSKFIANFLDETEFVTKLNRLSYYDTLTGLKNRQSYNDAIKSLNKKHIESLGVIYIDIKGLSAINDSKGVLYGDTILKRLAEILTDIYGEDVYRVGGDEFVVFRENITENQFEENVNRLKSTVNLEKEFNVTVGYTWNQNYDVASQAFNHYTGSEKYKHILAQNLEMEIAAGKFAVFLQPQVTLATGKTESAEALVRRVGGGGTYQPPVSFIPFYEKEGIISKLDTFVFETVCRTLKEWRLAGHEEISSVAVNCSRMTIAEVGIVRRFSEICEQYGVKPSQLVIEITETTNAISENVLRTITKNFTEAGFAISLDDFGSGYSNLTSFVISDFDEVKIDMKIINDIHLHEKSKALTEVVLVLCNKLNSLISVAEGVECEEQHNILKDMGCTKGQGYLFDKPLPIDEFAKKYVL